MDKISEVAAHIKQAKGNVCFITGAGASKTANIPTANELIQLVIKKYPHCLNKLTEADQTNYGKVMAELAPAEREQLITPLLEKSGINWGHIALASMIKGNYIKRVLTFNFDQILEKAVSLLGMQLPVYDFGGAPTSDINRIANPSILHLHGQSHGLVLLNTDEETQKHKESLHPILKDTIRDHITIVIGYSGETDGALKVISEEFNSYNRLIWLGHKKDAPACLHALLAKDYAEYIGGCDFDQTMIKIAQYLDIWPPSIIQNPIQHLLEELNEVQDFPPEKDAEVDVLNKTRERLSSLVSDWQSTDDPDNEVFSKLMSGQFTEEEINTFVKGHETLSESGKKALSWVLIIEAHTLAKKAKILSGKSTQDKYEQAYQKYEQAIIINPKAYDAYLNWAIALSEEAITLSEKEAREKFKQAYQNYEQANKIKPNDYHTYSNWGTSLLNEARLISGKLAFEKIIEAEKKSQKAKSIINKGNYNLACAFALTDKIPKALKELTQCNKDGTLPKLKHLETDTDMDPLRETKEFQELISSLKEN